MIAVRLLGQFDIRRDGQPVELPSRPAQSLLAYLLLNAGIEYRREKLAGVIWPEATDDNARTYLRQALWRIRKAIGADYLLADRVTVAFKAGADYWLDVDILEEPLDDGWTAGSLEKVIDVYQGELLPGFYEDWVVLERERLQNVFEGRISQLLDRLIEEGRWNNILHWGERWIALGHVPEPAYRALMIAHAGLGDLAGMANAYRRCHQALEEDLGVEPSAETRQLYRDLCAGEKPAVSDSGSEPMAATMAPSAPRATIGETPSPPAFLSEDRPQVQRPEEPFVGREQELNVLDSYLQQALERLTTIHSYSGGGSSRLSTQGDLFAEYADFLVDLSRQQPLLLILDDLHWADSSSIGLLGHLGHRLSEGAILIAGAYRPEEVNQGREDQPHPLVAVLGEYKRRFGRVLVNLDDTGTGDGRSFIDGLLDVEANALDEEFRQALTRHTNGHPLFTIELLREMQERGALLRDEAGRWVLGPDFDWDVVPPRVEGVIETRISHLDQELSQWLELASVEGEAFTAEVIAQALDLEAREIVEFIANNTGKPSFRESFLSLPEVQAVIENTE